MAFIFSMFSSIEFKAIKTDGSIDPPSIRLSMLLLIFMRRSLKSSPSSIASLKKSASFLLISFSMSTKSKGGVFDVLGSGVVGVSTAGVFCPKRFLTFTPKPLIAFPMSKYKTFAISGAFLSRKGWTALLTAIAPAPAARVKTTGTAIGLAATDPAAKPPVDAIAPPWVPNTPTPNAPIPNKACCPD